MQGGGQDVVALSPGSVAPLTQPHAVDTQGGMAAGLLHAGPAAKRPTPDAAAADTPSSEVPALHHCLYLLILARYRYQPLYMRTKVE